MKNQCEQIFESYNHRVLWNAAVINLSLVTSGDKYAALGAMLMSFLAFEGYLNWLGVHIAPDVWNDEQQFFSREPFKGTMGKYRFLAKLLRLPSPDASKGPFQTAKELLRVRDLAVHPRAESGARDVRFDAEHHPLHYQSTLEKAVSPDNAIRAKEHVEFLAEELHREARLAYSADVTCNKAFDSIIGFSVADA